MFKHFRGTSINTQENHKITGSEAKYRLKVKIVFKNLFIQNRFSISLAISLSRMSQSELFINYRKCVDK